MEGRVDRYVSGNREDPQKRGNASSQLDTMRESTGAEREMEGRIDRYASIRESHSRDSEQGGKGTSSSTYDWRKPHMASSAHGLSWSAPFLCSSTTTQDPRLHGQNDGSGGSQSPLVSPYSGSSSLMVDVGHDDTIHLSPPKRPRLGWGQGLAKYEKKKVSDVDDAGRTSAVHKGEVTSKVESQCEQESSSERLQVPAGLTEILSNENFTTSKDCAVQKAEQTLDEDQRTLSPIESGVITLLEVTSIHADRSANTGAVRVLASSPTGTDRVDAAQHRLTGDADETASGEEQVFKAESPRAAATVGMVEDSSGWTKEVILQKVEKVECEIDLVEKELARLLTEEEGQEGDNNGGVGDQGGNSIAVEDKVSDANAAVDHVGVQFSLGTQSPCVDSVMVDTDGKEAREANSIPVSTSGEPPSPPDEAHIVASQPSKTLDESSEDSGHSEDADALKEITNDMQPEQSRPPARDLHLKISSEDFSPSESREVTRDQRAAVNALLESNRKLAVEAEAPFSILLSRNCSQDRSRVYESPEDAPVWRENTESHLKNQLRMQCRLAERKKQLRFKERVLALKYRVLKEECENGGLGICQRKDRVKAGRRWEVERRNTSTLTLPAQRSTLRLRPVQACSPRLIASQDEGIGKKRIMTMTTGNHLRQDLKMPSMIIDDKERSFHRFVNTNGLVEDPVAYEQERKAINPWTSEEKKTFLEKFNAYYKNFCKIASFLEHKTTADCVEYYYRNQKSEDLEKVKRRHQLLKKKKESIPASSSYLATASPGTGRNHQRDGNGTRVQALTLAAFAASRDCSKTLRVSSQKALEKSRLVSKHEPATPELWGTKAWGAKEGKSQSNPEASTSGISPGTLSAAATSASKHSGEKLSGKIGSGHSTPNTKTLPSDQPSVMKGMRTTVPHRDPFRIDGEAVDLHWTDAEIELFTEAVTKFGKEFKSIADLVRTKTHTQCKTFFSKYRKRFKLDELVEQVQDTSALVGLLGVKSEAPADHKVQSFVDTVQSAGVETACDQAQDVDATDEENRSNTADVIVGVDALMLLGEAKEMESLPGLGNCAESSTAVPTLHRELSTVLETVSQISGPASEIADLPFSGSELASKVSDIPPVVSTLLSRTSSSSPSKASTSLPKLPDSKSVVSDLSVKLHESQAKVSSHQACDAVRLPIDSNLVQPVEESALIASDIPLNSTASTPSGPDLLPYKLAGMTELTSVVEAQDAHSLKVLSKKVGGSLVVDEKKHLDSVVKVEQVEQVIDDSQALDRMMILREGATVNDVNALKSESKSQEPATVMSGMSRDKADGHSPARTVEKPSGPPLTIGEANPASVEVKAEVISHDMRTIPSCVGGSLPPSIHVVAVPVTSTPLVQIGQLKERGSRVAAPGEFKPRREPTSWTQEEKETFAEIIRTHGKDWTLLQERLPAKSLTQIKTYFQNSKAKLGFLSDGLVSLPARGNATRKRKGEESDTSSHAGSAVQTSNPKMLLSGDDMSQKIIASSMTSIGANIGTPVTSTDGLVYAPFNPGFGEDPSNIRDFQKVIRRMCSGNEYPSQGSIPGGLVPLFQPGAFPAPSVQAPLLSAQKPPQAMVGHVPQQQGLSTQSILQQPMTSIQRQLLTKVLQQLQQHQAPQMASHQPQQLSHQFQQQVTQMVAAKQQLQQQHLASQVAKHIQPQLHMHHTQQAIPLASNVHQQQLLSRSKHIPSQQPPQAVRVHHQVSQHPAITQQQQLLQHKQQLLFQHLQQEQIAQHLHHQLQAQKQIQPQQLHPLQQLHLQFQKEHAQAQQQVQPQTQQQIQQQVQQQIQHTMGLFRGPFQGFFPDIESARQPETLEPKNVATNQPLLSLEDLQVEAQRIAQIMTPQPARPTSPSERLRPADVKLFGQSLLSQPTVNSGQHTTGATQKLWQPVTAPLPPVPGAMPSNNQTKGFGKDAMMLNSGFSRTTSSLALGEGEAQHPWPATSSGSLDLWNSMMGGLQSVALYKSDDAKSDMNNAQETMMSTRPTLEAHSGHQLTLSAVEETGAERLDPGAATDQAMNKPTDDVVKVTDTLDLRSTLAKDRTRMEMEWRNDVLQQTSSDQRGAQSIVGAEGLANDVLTVHQWAAPLMESKDGKSVITSIGTLSPHLKKLAPGVESTALRSNDVYTSQPHPAQPIPVNTWPSSLTSHATESQLVPAGTSFNSVSLISGQSGGSADSSVPSNMKILESGNG